MTYDELVLALNEGRYQSTVRTKYIILQIEPNKVEVFQVLEEREKSIKIRMVSKAVYRGQASFFLPKASLNKYCFHEILHLKKWYIDVIYREDDKQAKVNLTILT